MHRKHEYASQVNDPIKTVEAAVDRQSENVQICDIKWVD